MHSNPTARAMSHQRTGRITALVVSTLALASANADPSRIIEHFGGSVGVAPAVSDVGKPRTITVNATWPNACPPQFDVAAMEPGINPTNLIVRFNVPATLVACAQVETPFAASVSFTPTRDGDVTITAITNDDRVLARGTMLTLPQNAPGSENLSGVWLGVYASSVLMLAHSEGASDNLVGTVNMFAQDGSAHWQFINGSRRTASNVFEAVLNDFSVPPNSGNCLNAACPVRGLIGREAGMLQLVIEKDREATIELFSTATSHPSLPVGTPIFKTSITRIKL